MKRFFTILAFLISGLVLQAQPYNDFPCTAIPLPVNNSCSYQTFATNGATRSQVSNPSCGNYAGSNDVWFVVQVPANGGLVINTAPGSLNNMSMAVYTATACNGTFTQISCVTNGGASANMPGLTLNNRTPGELLFIRIWDRVCTNIFQCGLPTDGYQQGTFQICVTESFNSVPPVTQPGTGGYNCNNTPRAGNTCEQATPICSFNGFCGSTSGYSANYWYSGSRGLGGPLNAQGIFCGSIENNSFIRFVAGSTSVVLDVIVSGSVNRCSDGVQFMMFGNPTGAPSCQSLDIVSYGCQSPMPPGTNRFTASGLTIGQEYYLMVDGFGGDICNYQINAISGVLIGAAAGQEERTVCLGETVPLSVFGAGQGTITWSGPFLNQTTGQTVTATPTAPGRYRYIVEAPNISPECSGRPFDYDTVYITVVNPFADFDLTQSGGCSGTGTILTASGGFTYVWGPAPGVPQTTGPGITVNPAVPTTYTVTASNAQGCRATKSIEVGPGTTGPQLIITSNKDTACAGTGGITLAASSGFSSYTWSPATGLSSSTGQTVTANPTNPGNYTYTVTATLAGCPNATAQKTITIISGGAVTVSPNNPNICSGQSVTLTASPAGSYNWTAPGFSQNGVGSISVSPSTNTTYTAASTVCQVSGSATVNVAPAPAALTAVNGSRCGPGEVTLSVTGNCNGNIRWFDDASGGNQVATGNTHSPNVSSNTTFYASCTVNNCEGPRVPVTATLTNNPPNISVTPTVELSCTTGQATLSGGSTTPGVTLSWSGPGIVSGAGTGAPVVNAPGTYTLTVTNPVDGCTATADVQVLANTSQPNANAGTAPTITCTATSVNLNGSSSTPGVSFSWNGPGIVSGGNTPTPLVNQGGTYILTVTNTANGCSSTDQVAVNVDNTPPDVSINNPGPLDCTNPSLTLNASSSVSGVSYTWTGPGIVSGGSTAAPVINTPGTYSVTVSNTANGCTNSASVNVSGGTNVPNVNINSPATLSCTTGTITLFGSSTTPGVSFNWTGPGIVSGANSATPLVNAPGIYVLTVTDPANGCTASDQMTVSQDIATPDVSIVPPGVLDCNTAQVNITGNSSVPNVGYSWSGPGIVSGANSPTVTVDDPGTYNLTVTNPANGCTASTQVVVAGDPNVPVVTISTPPALTCLATSVDITAQSSISGSTFSWTGSGIVGGAASPTITVNQAGTYTLVVTNPANGCSKTENVVVSADNTLPSVSIAAPSTLTCLSPQTTLNATGSTGGLTYSWSGPGISGTSNQPSVNVNQAGTYVVTITNPQNGCSNSAPAEVIEDKVLPSVAVNADPYLGCSTGTASATAVSNTPGVTYSWTGPGITGNPNQAGITVNAAGTYQVTVSNPANGCSSVASADILPPTPFDVGAEIFANPCPQVEAGAILLSISGGSAPFSFQWSNGSADQDLIGVKGGSYSVIITDAAGCSQQATYVVPQEVFEVRAFRDATINFGDSISIYAEVKGGAGNISISWLPPDFLSCTACLEAVAKPLKDIFYVFTAIDSNGCQASDTIFIDVKTDFDIYFPNAITPNGDRLNDQFRALGRTDLVTSYLLQIFNRWGELVFETNDINRGWDGTHKGQQVSSDGFIHAASATFMDGQQRSYRGVVLVLR